MEAFMGIFWEIDNPEVGDEADSYIPSETSQGAR